MVTDVFTSGTNWTSQIRVKVVPAYSIEKERLAGSPENVMVGDGTVCVYM